MASSQSTKCTNDSEDEDQLLRGRKFSSYKELQNFIQKYEGETQQVFVKTNSRSLKNSQVRRACRPELEYFEICFKCIHGKRQRPSEATGIRKTWTTKLDCNAFIKIHASDDGEHLEITEINNKHNNHPGTEAFYKLQPKNKKLTSCEKEQITNLLKLRSNKKFIQDYTRDKFDKHLSMKDIHNIASTLTENDDDTLSKAVETLQNTYGASVSVLHENNIFKGLYFSTKQMRDDMELWPEIVFIDGTYKLLKRNLTVMILLVEDSMGLGKVVGTALLAQEDRPTFQWFLNCFKEEHQTTWLKMQCMMGDKDLNERDVLKEIFPNIPIYICLFHTLRTFGREISREKMNITSEQRTKSLQFLDRLAKSTSETAYETTYEKFSNEVPQSVLNYFNKNWHPIKHEWTKYSMTSGNLENLTNNRLESINSKIKQVVKKHSTLVAFVHSFFKWLINREHEMLNKVAKNFLKKKITVHESGSAEHQYMDQLTTYAFSVVEREILHHKAITVRKSDNNSKTCVILVNHVELTVTPLSCECSTWKSMFLPCRHIFATRKLFNLPLFAKELCSDRWKKSYNFQKNSLDQETEVREGTDLNRNNVSITQCIPQKKYSETQKRKLLKMVTDDIVHMGLLSTESNFRSRLELLHQICNSWREGHEVFITNMDTEEENSAHISLLDCDSNCDDEDNVISTKKDLPMTTNEELETSYETLELERDLEDLNIDNRADLSSQIKDDLNKFVLPVPLKLRNRSKRADATIVKYTKMKKRPIRFLEQEPEVQARTILHWFISDNEQCQIENALTGEYMIRDIDIPSEYRDLPDSVMADEVDLSVLKQYMENAAYEKIVKLIQKKKDLGIWTCKICKKDLSDRSVLCESCLAWHDYKCVNLRRAPKSEEWYCRSCKL